MSSCPIAELGLLVVIVVGSAYTVGTPVVTGIPTDVILVVAMGVSLERLVLVLVSLLVWQLLVVCFCHKVFVDSVIR